MNFGVPNQKKQRKEKFPNEAVMTVVEMPSKKGASRKIELSETLVEMLGLDDKKAQVVFSFEGTDIRIANADQAGIPDEYKLNVTKSRPRKISDKRTYDYISKILDLDTSRDTHFSVANSRVDDGITTYGVYPYGAIARSVTQDAQMNDVQGDALGSDMHSLHDVDFEEATDELTTQNQFN